MLMKQINYKLMTVFSSVALAIASTAGYADPAPVYDADAMQFDGVSDQDMPPPPPPGQEVAFQDNQANQVVTYGGPPPAMVNASMPPSTTMPMEQRVQRLEQMLYNVQNSDASARIESLQTQLQAMRNQLEQLTHQLQLVQNQQKLMYADLEKRIVNNPAAAGPGAPNVTTMNPAMAALASSVARTEPAKPMVAQSQTAQVATEVATAAREIIPVATQPNVVEEQSIYQTAYNHIKAKRYDDAVSALQGMLKKYPSGQFASNAHYWLGELYGLMGKNDKALSEFDLVVDRYPDSPRVSDAQLKLGLIYASQFKWFDAKDAFKKVMIQYPGTASARLASEQLKQIRRAGH